MVIWFPRLCYARHEKTEGPLEDDRLVVCSGQQVHRRAARGLTNVPWVDVGFDQGIPAKQHDLQVSADLVSDRYCHESSLSTAQDQAKLHVCLA